MMFIQGFGDKAYKLQAFYIYDLKTKTLTLFSAGIF